LNIVILFLAAEERITYVCVDYFMNTRRKLRLHAQTLGTYTSALGSAILLVDE
jgi:hypothetical protein